MQPDRGMMWQAENPELAREFPAGTASKARQSRLHQAQGVFPVFVFHSFVQFLNISRASCSKKVCRVLCRVLTRWCSFCFAYSCGLIVVYSCSVGVVYSCSVRFVYSLCIV